MRRTTRLALLLAALAPAAALAAAPAPLDLAPVDEMLFESSGRPIRASAFTDLFEQGDGFLLANRRSLAIESYDRNGRRTGGGALAAADPPRNASPLALDRARDRIVAIDRDRDLVYVFAASGALVGTRPVRGGERVKRRISQVDVKTFEYGDRAVHLDFMGKVVACAFGEARTSVRYDALHPGCEVFEQGGRLWFLDPRARSIAALPGFSPRFTGEALVAAGGGTWWLVDRVRSEAVRCTDDGETVAVHAPVEKRGPYIEDVAVFPDGGYCLLDGRDARIWLYAADGTRQSVFGMKGEEPGRMLQPTALVALPGDRLLVRDAGRGRALLFDRAGRFLAEWQDLVDAPAPGAFRAFLDRDGKVNLVHLLDRRLHAIRGGHAWLREFNRLLGSEARHPREYLTLAADGAILYFDAAKGQVEALAGDATVAGRAVADGLARFLETPARRYGACAVDGKRLLAVSGDGRIDAIDLATGSAVPVPVYGEASAVAVDPAGAVYALYASGRITRVSPTGRGDWSLDLKRGDLLLEPAGVDELFVAEPGGRRVVLLGAGGRRLASLDLASGTVRGLSARGDRLAVFLERDGSLGVARFRRREVYKEADGYYNNGLYRMAAVRYEALLAAGHDGPDVRLKLHDCYRRLDRPELAERERLLILNSWPGSAEAKRLRAADRPSPDRPKGDPRP